MELLENIFLLLGIALCALALLPLGLWTAQSLSTFSHNRKQFAISQEVMRQQILQAVRDDGPAVTSVAAEDVSGADDSRSTVATHVAASQVSRAEPSQPVVVTRMTADAVAADGTWSGSRMFQVVKLVKETATCTSVYLVPADGKPIATFVPGQHLSLKFAIPGQAKPVYRCYSLSDAPGKIYYRISVKAIPAQGDTQAGMVSNYINHQLQEGDTIEARSPAGSFKLDTDDQRPVVMLGGGIGVTPMISMIETMTAQFPDRVAILVYGVRNKADQAFQAYLHKKAVDHRNLHVISCYSDPSPSDVQGEDYQVKGHVSATLLEQVLPNKNCQYYLCGPPPFMKSLSDGLAAWSIPDSQIFSETFGPAAINRKAASVEATIASATPGVDTPVTFGASGKTVSWSSDFDSLLDLAEANDVDIPFGCRAGSCGTCATKIVSGEVEYPDGQNVGCEPSECLTCVARPQGPLDLGA